MSAPIAAPTLVFAPSARLTAFRLRFVPLALALLFTLAPPLPAQSATAPTVTGSIGDRIVIVGDSIQFQVYASGSTPLTYQWKKNGANLANGGNVVGATTEVLQLSSVQRSDDALYSCTVSNSAGSATSNGAHLTVRELRIVTPPASQTVSQGGSATFTVGVSATDPLTYQWWKDGDKIPGATGATFTVTNAQAASAGRYWVDVTSVVNTIGSGAATLTVGAAPVITVQPRSASGLAGAGFVFGVGVTGSGPFTYQWRKDGAPIAGATREELVFASAQPADNGSYSAVVSNASGSATSSAATLTVFSVTLNGPRAKVYDGAPLALTATTVPAGLAYTMVYVTANGTTLGGPPVNAGFFRGFAMVNDGLYKGTAGADLTISPAGMTVSFSNLQQTYDGKPHPIVATTNPPGLPLRLEYGGPNAGPPIAAGSYQIIAYSENWNYNFTYTQTVTLVVAKASQSIAFGALPASPAPGTPIELSATASSGLSPIAFSVVSGNATVSGNRLTIADTGSVTIRATQAGDNNYLPATADFTFSAGKQNQTITFAALADRTTSAPPQVLSASASSGLPVTFTLVSGPATLGGSTLTLSGAAGTVVVRATQAGDAGYNAAPGIERSFVVTTIPPPTITAQPQSQTVDIDGSATFSVTATTSGGGALTYQWFKDSRPIGNFTSPTITLNRLQLADTGTITVAVSNGAASTMSAGATLTVTPASNPAAVPPAIDGQPVSQTAAQGSNVSFTVGATGTAQLYYQWRKDGTPILGAVSPTLPLPNVQPADAGSYTVVVVNSAGTVTSQPATLAVNAAPTGGTTTPPSGGTPPPPPPPPPPPGGTTTPPAPSGGGSTTPPAPPSGGSTTTPTPPPVGVTTPPPVSGGGGAPIADGGGGGGGASTPPPTPTPTTPTPPPSGGIATGPTSPAGGSAPTPISGGAGGTVSSGTGTGSTGSGSSGTASGGGSVGATTTPIVPSVPPSAPPAPAVTTPATPSGDVASTARLLNLSIRGAIGAGEDALVVGLVTRGTGTKQVLLRAIGPGLAQFAVAGALPDPVLRLFDGAGRMMQSNAGWSGDARLSEAFRQVGAFPLAVASGDAAVFASTSTGPLTAQVSSASSHAGLTLIEAYDADAGTAATRFVNLSARARVGTGAEALTVGFVIGGNAPVTLLLRGIGPTLAQFGVTGTLADPELALFDAAGKQVAQNADWGGAERLTAAFARTGAFALPAGARDAALLVTLPPGQYTARISGSAGATGTALIEVYEAP